MMKRILLALFILCMFYGFLTADWNKEKRERLEKSDIYLVVWLEWEKVNNRQLIRTDADDASGREEMVMTNRFGMTNYLRSYDNWIMVYSKKELVKYLKNLIKVQAETNVIITDVEVYKLKYIPVENIITNRRNF